MIQTVTFRNIIILFIVILLAGCASQKYSKLALKNEQAGLYEDAAELYLKSLQKNKENIEAKIGAKKDGQIVLDQKLEKFTNAYSSGDSRNAVYLFLLADKFCEKFLSYGIQLEFATKFRDQFKEVREMHIEECYKKGTTYLNEEKFDLAELKFKEIISLKKDYKDSRDLWQTAYCEPLYRKGKRELNNKMFRKSYYIFDKITKEIGEYKETSHLKQDALNEGIIPISVTDFESPSNLLIASTLRNLIISNLANSENPFIKIVDKGVNSESVKSYNVKAKLTGSIVYLNISDGDLNKKSTRGFLRQVKYSVVNGQTIPDYNYKKIHYLDVSQRNTVRCMFKYQLISLVTGAVLISGEIPLSNSDEIHYAYYDGDYRNVFSGYWKWELIHSSEDIIRTGFSDIYKLQSLFTANRNIKPTGKLVKEIIDEISDKTCSKIIDYNPEN